MSYWYVKGAVGFICGFNKNVSLIHTECHCYHLMVLSSDISTLYYFNMLHRYNIHRHCVWSLSCANKLNVLGKLILML